MQVFPHTDTLQSPTTNSGEILYVLGWLTATIMWGFGLVWLFFALASITRSRFPFNMGWWGFVFPLGVFTSSTTQMSAELPSEFFKVLGTVCYVLIILRVSDAETLQIFSVAVTLLWVVVSVGTIKKAISGEIFVAPCLKDLDINKEKGQAPCSKSQV